jgi:hypothetical protein
MNNNPCSFPPPSFIQKEKEQTHDLPSRVGPVFLIFLDCVRQMTLQHSESFEFDQDLLLFLFDCAHDGRFGNFFGDSHKDREKYGTLTNTPSVWWFILEQGNRKKFIKRAAIDNAPLDIDDDSMFYFIVLHFTASLPAFQPSSLPTFQPSSLPAFQPSSLPAFQPSSFQPSSLPAFQPSSLPASFLLLNFL